MYSVKSRVRSKQDHTEKYSTVQYSTVHSTVVSIPKYVWKIRHSDGGSGREEKDGGEWVLIENMKY